MAKVITTTVQVTADEAELLYQASRGEFSCPRCGRLLKAEIIVGQVYNDVSLYCDYEAGCEYRQL